MSPKKLHANIVLLTCLLCIIGLLMAFSTTSTYYFNDGGIGNPFNGLYKQFLFLLIGALSNILRNEVFLNLKSRLKRWKKQKVF